MKHWTEPNGIFIINIPIEWQYKNVLFDYCEESPYGFEPYEKPLGCFQISCYPLAEKGINPRIKVHKLYENITWEKSKNTNKGFDMYLWGAQIDDQLCFAKYIYATVERSNPKIIDQIVKVNLSLESLTVIPLSQRTIAADLNKYDNFLASLAASYDIRNNAFDNKSYIELIVIVANQIDAFLRLSIVIKKQLINKTNDLEVEYLFQGNNDKKKIMERNIYSQAETLGIINNELLERLNKLYDQRNRVIHRYIISKIKTRDIIDIAYRYNVICEEIRLICSEIEESQFGCGFGIYGTGFTHIEEFDEKDRRRIFSMTNDKHLISDLKRELL